jgi:hypothetical protein
VLHLRQSKCSFTGLNLRLMISVFGCLVLPDNSTLLPRKFVLFYGSGPFCSEWYSDILSTKSGGEISSSYGRHISSSMQIFSSGSGTRVLFSLIKTHRPGACTQHPPAYVSTPISRSYRSKNAILLPLPAVLLLTMD